MYFGYDKERDCRMILFQCAEQLGKLLYMKSEEEKLWVKIELLHIPFIEEFIWEDRLFLV